LENTTRIFNRLKRKRTLGTAKKGNFEKILQRRDRRDRSSIVTEESEQDIKRPPNNIYLHKKGRFCRIRSARGGGMGKCCTKKGEKPRESSKIQKMREKGPKGDPAQHEPEWSNWPKRKDSCRF